MAKGGQTEACPGPVSCSTCLKKKKRKKGLKIFLHSVSDVCLVSVEVLCNNALFKNPLSTPADVTTGVRRVNVEPHGTRSLHVSLRVGRREKPRLLRADVLFIINSAGNNEFA